MNQSFFSFVVPAHNEEAIIARTLERLRQLDYPRECYEVIVIENGSSDRTLEIAKEFESAGFRVLVSELGVSRAKNAGIDHLSSASDWVVFLDADTLIEADFLTKLSAYLSEKDACSVGTVSLLPLPQTAYARAWFFIHNVGHMLSKTSYAIKIVRRGLFPTLRFDETLATGEDIDLIRKAQAHGTFFFMWTKSVATSTRRFEKLGLWRTTLSWGFVALLPLRWRRSVRYEVVR